MNMFNNRNQSHERIVEEYIYEQVALELRKNEKRVGLWTKAIALSLGDESKVESIYIQLRAESIVDEAKVANEIYNSENRVSIVEEKEPFELGRLIFKLIGIAMIALLTFAFLSAIQNG